MTEPAKPQPSSAAFPGRFGRQIQRRIPQAFQHMPRTVNSANVNAAAGPGLARPPLPRPASSSAPASVKVRKPVILGVDHIKRAIGDAGFYAQLPEFLAVKRKLDAMHVDFNTGCSPCKKRRVATSLTSDFVSILTGLSDDGMTRIKKYLGVPKLLVRSINKQTGRMEMKEI